MKKWREVSGQSEANCQIFNTSFSERGGDILSEVNGSLGEEKQFINNARMESTLDAVSKETEDTAYYCILDTFSGIFIK